MKKKLISKLLFLLIIIGSILIKAQDITFVPQDTSIVGILGTDMIFHINVTNISTQDQNVFMIRTLNDLPTDWTSSLCFESCVAPTVDSLAAMTPFSPGESRIVEVHVFAQNNVGTAHVQIKGGTFRNPNSTISVNLTAIVNPTSVDDEIPALYNFSLSQNYPNPFNPSTKMLYKVPANVKREMSKVILKVYNVLGNDVATLVNEYKPAGSYELDFDGGNLPSGIYLYRLSTHNFTQTRKMILEK